MPHSATRQVVVAARATTLHTQLIRELAEGEVATPQWLVVPGRPLVEHLRRQVAVEQQASVSLRGVTFLELAQILSAEARREYQRSTLSPQAATWLARRYLEQADPPHGFFDKVLRVRGFRQSLLRTFEELSISGLIHNDDIEKLLVQHADQLSRRVRHALELFLGWRQSFEATHDDPARILAGAQQAAATTAQRLGTSVLRVVGFGELRPLERRLLLAMADDASLQLQVWATDDAPLWGPLRQAWGDACAVRRLQDAAPRAASNTAPATAQALSAPGEEAEAVEVGRRLLRAAEEGAAFDSMAVLTRTTRSHPLLRDTLARVGIPSESIPGQPLSQLRPGRALMQFLSLTESGLVPRASIDFLTLAPLRWQAWAGFEEPPVPSAWARVATEARLGEGVEDWRARLPRFAADLLRQAEHFSSSGEPSKRVQRLAASAGELLHVGERLHEALQHMPERGRWSEWVQRLEEHLLAWFERDDATIEVERAVRRLCALEIRGHGSASRAAFREAVRQTLSTTGLPHQADAHHGAVTLGTEESLRGMAFDHVVLMGLRDGEWPASVPEDPILSDEDRALLREAIGDPHALPSRAALALHEQAHFTDACTRGRRNLLLTYARLDPTTGAARLPSAFLMQWAQRSTEETIDYASFETLPQVERVPLTRREAPDNGPIVSPEEYDGLAIAGLSRGDARRYVRQLGELPRRGLTLDTMRSQRRRFTAYDGMLTAPDVRRSLRQRVDARAWSISQVHAWSTCPFRFFMRRMLQLEPLDTDGGRELDALALGRLVHDILENFHQRLQDQRIDVQQVGFEALKEQLQRASQHSFEKLEAQGQTGSRLLWQLRKTTLLEDLTLYLRHELRRGEWGTWWRPQAFEAPFGPDADRQLTVSRDGMRLQFRGFIDRLDTHATHEGLLVVDYKSGRKLDPRRFPSAGQLVVYLLAATGGDPDLLDTSEGRFVYVTRRGDFAVQRMRGADVRQRRDDFENLVVSVAQAVAQGDFHPEPGDKAEHCTFCDYRGLCDGRISQQAERKAVAGQGARFESLPDFADILHDLPEPAGG